MNQSLAHGRGSSQMTQLRNHDPLTLFLHTMPPRPGLYYYEHALVKAFDTVGTASPGRYLLETLSAFHHIAIAYRVFSLSPNFAGVPGALCHIKIVIT